MSKKAILFSYINVSQRIKDLEEALAELRMSQIWKGLANDGMPHAPGITDLSGYAARVDELETAIRKAASAKVMIKREFRRACRFLTTQEKNVIWSRYICDRMAAETSRLYHIPRRTYYEILKRGEEKISIREGDIIGFLHEAGVGDHPAK